MAGLASMRIRVVDMKFKPVMKAAPKITRKVNVKIARQMQRELRATIDVSYPPASAPGTPPHKRTGRLQRRTTVRAEGSTIKVRTTQYGIYLEGGTRKMAAHPFIRPTIHAKRREWGRRRNTLMRKELAKVAKKRKPRRR